jgi:molybdate transport system substrate-binding protein
MEYPLASKVIFSVLSVNNVPNLLVGINDPQLAMFFAGNQFIIIGYVWGAIEYKGRDISLPVVPELRRCWLY